MHSYNIGVFSTEALARQAALDTEEWRGGKYECEILGWELDADIHIMPKEIKSIYKLRTSGDKSNGI